MNYELHPGPLNSDVLFLHEEHRARAVYIEPENYRESINVKSSDRSFWSEIKRNPTGGRAKTLMQQAGYGGVLGCGYRYIDHPLINALVERWRSETHTFHLPVGEATIMLEDINLLWGLSIEGAVVSRVDSRMSPDGLVTLCQNLLGFTPAINELSRKSILSCSIMREIKQPFSETEATDLQCIIRACLIIFYLIGCTLLPDNSNNKRGLIYLDFVRNLTACAQFSWGSAVLGHLYRNLCNATSRDAISITKPVFILQIWAWERICCMAPEPDYRFDYSTPLAARWQQGELRFKETPSHCLRTYHSQLQSSHEGMFNWTPYRDVIDRLPAMCRSGTNSRRSACPLICWEIVEHHYPQRVMR